MPDFSVIIPTYNRVDCIERALCSVFNQSLAAREVIVVDDGSTDDTREVVRSRFPSVRWIEQPHGGVARARNSGIRQSEGEWIAFLDSDDEWLTHKLREQWDALCRQPAYKLCHSDEIWIRNGQRLNQKQRHAKAGGYVFRECLPLCAISPSSVVIHRSVFHRIGLFDESLPVCEDYDMWLRVCAVFPVLFVPSALLIKHGGHADQLSRRYWGMDRFRIRALEKIIDSDGLGAEDRRAAIEMIRHKIVIYVKGAHKRGRRDEVKHYTSLLAHYSELRRSIEVATDVAPVGCGTKAVPGRTAPASAQRAQAIAP